MDKTSKFLIKLGDKKSFKIGKVRIIYKMQDNQGEILRVGFRSEDTYKEL